MRTREKGDSSGVVPGLFDLLIVRGVSVRIKGNEIQLEGKDLVGNEEFYGIMLRFIEDMRKQTGDPEWAGEGRTKQQEEARDTAIRLYGAKLKASDRIAKAQAKYGQLPEHQLN